MHADDFDEVLGPVPVAGEGQVLQVVTDPAGDRHALLVPVGVRRLKGEAAHCASDLQRAALAVREAQENLADQVAEARELGLSWNVVGWCVGTTSEAARQRWGT